jgi:hypothetical protein
VSSVLLRLNVCDFLKARSVHDLVDPVETNHRAIVEQKRDEDDSDKHYVSIVVLVLSYRQVDRYECWSE